MEDLLVALSAACVMAVIGYFIGKTKGRGAFGGVLGFLLGPIGWVIVLLLGKAEPTEKCRWCGRGVVANKKRCACGKRYDDTGASREVIDPVAQWDQQRRNQGLD